MAHSEVKHLPKVDHTPAELDEPAKLLMKAADLIEVHGLAKGEQLDSLGRMCIAGALIKACGRTPDQDDYSVAAREASVRFVRNVDPESWGPAPWNNKPERTKDEVVAKLRSVALGL